MAGDLCESPQRVSLAAAVRVLAPLRGHITQRVQQLAARALPHGPAVARGLHVGLRRVGKGRRGHIACQYDSGCGGGQ